MVWDVFYLNIYLNMYPHPSSTSALVRMRLLFLRLVLYQRRSQTCGGGPQRDQHSTRVHVCLSVCYCYQTTIANRNDFRLGAVLTVDNALLPP